MPIQVHLNSEEKNRKHIKTIRSHSNVTYRNTPRTQTSLDGVTRFGIEMTYKQGDLKGILRLELKEVVGSGENVQNYTTGHIKKQKRRQAQ